MELRPVTRTTLADSVVEQLLDQMRRGKLRPGDLLPPERELMAQFNVGRSTVREALQSLTRMGLLEARPGVGTVVKPVDFGSYLRPDVYSALMNDSLASELLEAREIIEVAIAGLAAQRASRADLQRIAETLEAASRALARHQPTHEFSALFHIHLAEAAHNTVLLNFMRSIYGLLRARGELKAGSEFLHWEIEAHRELYELIKSRDVEGARRKMLAHLRHSAHRLGELPDDQADPNPTTTGSGVAKRAQGRDR